MVRGGAAAGVRRGVSHASHPQIRQEREILGTARRQRSSAVGGVRSRGWHAVGGLGTHDDQDRYARAAGLSRRGESCRRRQAPFCYADSEQATGEAGGRCFRLRGERRRAWAHWMG